MMQDTKREGWAKNSYSRKYHYFINNNSLCRKHVLTKYDLIEVPHFQSMCATCTRKLLGSDRAYDLVQAIDRLEPTEKYELGYRLAGCVEEDATTDPLRIVLDYEVMHILDELESMGYDFSPKGKFIPTEHWEE